MHRYGTIGRPDAIQPAFDAVLGVVDDVFTIGGKEVEEAKRVVLGRYGLSARDAIHVAVMRTHDVHWIASFDTAFDRFPGVERLA